MDGSNFDSGAVPPVPQGPPVPPAPPGPPRHAAPSPPSGPTGQPQVFQQQPTAAPVSVTDGKPRSRSKFVKVLVGLAILSVASVVILVGAVVVASSLGLFDSDRIDSSTSSELDRPEATAAAISEEDASEQPTAVVPTTPDDVTITWAASPSPCDENNKRLFSADVGNLSAEALEVRMRILDSANNFVHQSHVYTVPASDLFRVDLGGIPPGQSIVQIITESNDEAIGQTRITFEGC